MGLKNISDLHPSASSEHCSHLLVPYIVVWSVFLIVLYSLVFYVGFQRRRRNKRSPVSHTDFFTFLMFSFEALLLCSYLVFVYGFYHVDLLAIDRGTSMNYLAYPGVILCHVLTCVERYLAVVHPVVYLKLSEQKWIRARKGIVLVIWAVCVLSWRIGEVSEQHKSLYLYLIGILIVVVSFCSVRVLRVLRNPSPGEGRGAGRAKQKAFFTMLAILAALMVWFVSGAVIYGILEPLLDRRLRCKLSGSAVFFQLPSSLVLPLLFLQRAGKLPKCGAERSRDPAPFWRKRNQS